MSSTTIGGFQAELKHLTNGDLRALHVHRHAGIFRPLEDDEREHLRASMERGYDEAHPIIVWAQTNEIVDGRNRRDIAAAELDLRDVAVAFVKFPDEDAVRDYVISQNLARRHLTTRERCELAGRLVLKGASTRTAAKQAGVSQKTAQRAASKARAAGESSDSPATKTTGADGKSYPATTKTRAAAKRKPSSTTAKPKRAARHATLDIVGHIQQATNKLRKLDKDGALTPLVLARIERADVVWREQLAYASAGVELGHPQHDGDADDDGDPDDDGRTPAA
jgi:transposase